MKKLNLKNSLSKALFIGGLCVCLQGGCAENNFTEPENAQNKLTPDKQKLQQKNKEIERLNSKLLALESDKNNYDFEIKKLEKDIENKKLEIENLNNKLAEEKKRKLEGADKEGHIQDTQIFNQ